MLAEFSIPYESLKNSIHLWLVKITLTVFCCMINRIYHRSLMQTKKSQPEGKLIMPETRFTEFPALSVDPRVGISLSALETHV